MAGAIGVRALGSAALAPAASAAAFASSAASASAAAFVSAMRRASARARASEVARSEGAAVDRAVGLVVGAAAAAIAGWSVEAGAGFAVGATVGGGRSVARGASDACATTAAMVGATRFCTARSCVKGSECVVVSFGSAAPVGKSARIINNARVKTCTSIDSAHASTCLRYAYIPPRRRKVRVETRVRARPARHPSLTRTSCYWSGRANERRSSQRSDRHLANLRRCARSCSRVSMWHA